MDSMNKTLTLEKMVVGDIHTFLKSYTDIKMTVFSPLSFSAWDVAHKWEIGRIFLLEEDMHSVKTKSIFEIAPLQIKKNSFRSQNTRKVHELMNMQGHGAELKHQENSATF